MGANKHIFLKIYQKTLKVIQKILLYLIVLIMVLVILLPFFWMISSSFKSTSEIQASDIMDESSRPSWIPKKITLRNFTEINRNVPILNCFKNSIIIGLGTSLITIFISFLAAYAFTRFKSFIMRRIRSFLYITQMIPPFAILIPFFIGFVYIKRLIGIPMRDTYLGMIIVYTSLTLPFSILILFNYFNMIPIELDEQAQIDGCNKLQTLIKVILPISLPGIMTIGIYSFLLCWNEILFAIILTGKNTRTISLGLMDYILILRNAGWGQVMAASIVVTIPVVILFNIIKDYMIEGYVRSYKR